MALTKREMDRRPGNYWHLYPLHAHARRALWLGVDPRTGVRYIDLHFPLDEREYVNESEMFIRMKNGATWQLLGSDHYDRLVGAGTLGIVVSEWALCDPRFWEYARPIVRENGGWIIFITTFRGRNHAFRMFEQLRDNPEWDCDLLTVRDTKREDGSPVISEADVAKDRAEGMSEALIQQEYYCNPNAVVPGAVYGSSMTRLLELGRANAFAYLPNVPVWSSWHLEDAPANISAAFFQRTEGGDVRCIGSSSWSFRELADVVADVRQLPFPISGQVLPSDDDGVFSQLFREQGFGNVIAAPARTPAKTALLTQQFLGRLSVDHISRPYLRDELNNELLMDSLNGYAMKQRSDDAVFSGYADTYHRYLVRTVEHFASAELVMGSTTRRPRNYTNLDRGVI